MRIVTGLVAAVLTLAAGGAALAKPATPAQMADFAAWSDCIGAVTAFKFVIVERQIGGDDDKALLERGQAMLPRVSAYLDPQAAQMDQADYDSVGADFEKRFAARLDALPQGPDFPSHILDEFRPDLQACLVKADSLPPSPTGGN